MMLNVDRFFKAEDQPVVFSADKLFPSELFGELLQTFPQDELEELMGDNFFAEMDSDRHQEQFKKFIEKTPVWKRLYREVSHRNFKRALLARFDRELTDIRGTKAVNSFRTIDTEVKCSFHLSRNGYLLSLHTDTGMKMVTVVIYLHEEGTELPGAGTRFYQAEDAAAGLDYIRGLLDDKGQCELDRPFGVVGVAVGRVYQQADITEETLRQVKTFDSLHKCALEVPFVGNHAVLFIKSNDSWHDVRLEHLQDDEYRKSFVINFSLVPSEQRNSIGRARRIIRMILSM